MTRSADVSNACVTGSIWRVMVALTFVVTTSPRGFATGLTIAPPVPQLAVKASDSARKSPTPPEGVHWLDSVVFARSIDSLSDVKPVTRTVLRASARIESVSIDLGAPSELFSMRPAKGAIEFESKDSKGKPLILGALRWDGQVLQWSWCRVAATTNSKALDALERALSTAAFILDLAGGGHESMYLPPILTRLQVAPGGTKRFYVAAPVGQVLLINAAANAVWTSSGSTDPIGTVALASDVSEIKISWDAATSECIVEWIAEGALELAALREEIAARRKESSKRSPAEQRIINLEIADLEKHMAEYVAAARMQYVQIADFPPITITGSGGRVFAKIDLVTQQKASK